MLSNNSHVGCVVGDVMFLKQFTHIRAFVAIMSYCLVV